MSTLSLHPPESCKVYTPEPLAESMVLAIGDRSEARWLEPCVGQGVFLQSLSKEGIAPRRVTAIDLDPAPGARDHLAKTLRGTDFLDWSLQTPLRFDRIIGNPPYVALEKLPSPLLSTALSISTPGGGTVGAGANYWYAFFCAGLQLLRKDGGLCLVLPASWDYASYASGLRHSLKQSFSRLEIHRTRRPLFKDVQEGCIVLVADGFGEKCKDLKRSEYPSAEKLIESLVSPRKRTTFRGSQKKSRELIRDNYVQLSDVINIRLGGVTGDAAFFLLTEEERKKRELPTACLRPVISKARHLVHATINRNNWSELRKANERVWLFRPSDELLKDRAVERYLRLKSRDGGCHRERYKIKNRQPWHRTPLPQRVDGFISGMSRFGPWISLKAMTGLNATNTLYTVRFRKAKTLDEKAAWSLALLTSDTQQALAYRKRIYADGLVKYEPSDLTSLPIPVPKRFHGARKVYVKTVALLLAGEEKQAHKVADDFFSSSTLPLTKNRVE